MAPLLNTDEPFYQPIRQKMHNDRECWKYENRLFYFKNFIRFKIPGSLVPNPSTLREHVGNFLKIILRLLFGKRKFPSGIHPYGGSDWFSISRDCLNYIIKVHDTNSKLTQFMNRVRSSSEIIVCQKI